MNAIPHRRNACPGLHDPMLSGDGWLARVAPPHARLDAAQATALAEASTRFGNGIVEITSRGRLQCRGLRAETLRPFADTIVALGLADPDPAADRRRHRLVCAPLATDDAFADTFRTAITATPALDALSPKFGFAIDDGPVSIGVDIGVAPGRHLLTLHDIAAVVSDLIAEALAIARVFTTSGARRMRDLDHATRRALLAARGHTPSDHAAWVPPDPVGRPAPGCVGVAPRYGAMQAAALAALADCASRHGDGQLRFAMSVILIAGCPDPDPLLAFLTSSGLVTDPADPRLRLRACAGAPSCASGEAPARTVADRFLPLVPAQGILHVSGCAKGCAHPRPAALTFTGSAGAYIRHHDARADGTQA